MGEPNKKTAATGDSASAPPVLVFLHGPPACGKLTIAGEVCALTGFSLFHNHLVVDLLLSVFPFGSPEFVVHRERIWLDVMGSAVAAGTSLVFTFNPERSVEPGFPDRLRERVQAAGGKVRVVEVRCSECAIEARIEAASRKEHRKLSSLAVYRELKAGGAFEFPSIESELTVDSTQAPPIESANTIVDALALRRVIPRTPNDR